mmetsp:Transcript_21289/g.68034  ORF Transcript_21289/g.68034 Transcript_21289/m.68034 type:complete len:204 (-) Transcript_21289:191-802(-)
MAYPRSVAWHSPTPRSTCECAAGERTDESGAQRSPAAALCPTSGGGGGNTKCWNSLAAASPPPPPPPPPLPPPLPSPPSPPAPPRSASLLPQSHSSRGRSSSLRRSERRARSSSTSSRDASSREEASSREGLGPGSRPAPPAVPTQWPAVASPSPLPAAALAREKRDEARRTEWRSSLTMTACWSASRRTVASSAASFATVLA